METLMYYTPIIVLTILLFFAFYINANEKKRKRKLLLHKLVKLKPSDFKNILPEKNIMKSSKAAIMAIHILKIITDKNNTWKKITFTEYLKYNPTWSNNNMTFITNKSTLIKINTEDLFNKIIKYLDNPLTCINFSEEWKTHAYKLSKDN